MENKESNRNKKRKLEEILKFSFFYWSDLVSVVFNDLN